MAELLLYLYTLLCKHMQSALRLPPKICCHHMLHMFQQVKIASMVMESEEQPSETRQEQGWLLGQNPQKALQSWNALTVAAHCLMVRCFTAAATGSSSCIHHTHSSHTHALWLWSVRDGHVYQQL